MKLSAVPLLLAALTVCVAHPHTGDEAQDLEKRDGTISVNGYSKTGCTGVNQGGTKVGTSGKCVNLSKAKSIKLHDSDSKNCDTVHAQYFQNTGCKGTKRGEFLYIAGNCVNIDGVTFHNSAFMKCTN